MAETATKKEPEKHPEARQTTSTQRPVISETERRRLKAAWFREKNRSRRMKRA